METVDISAVSLRTDSVAVSDYVSILKGGGLATVSPLYLTALLFVPGSGKVVVVNRGSVYPESQWRSYASTREIIWGTGTGSLGDIMVSRAVCSDSGKAIALFQTVYGMVDGGIKVSPFLFLVEGEAPAWITFPSS